MSVMKSVAGRSGKPTAASERFFGEVMGYDVSGEPKTMTVKHVETGEVRKVMLDPDAKIANIKEGFSRPDIDAFVKRGKMRTEIGGIVRVEDAVPVSDGAWKARWISSAVHEAGAGSVLRAAEARVSTLRSREGGGEYRFVDVLDGQAATRTLSADAFIAAVTEAIKSHGGAFVRWKGDVDGELKVRGAMFSGGDVSRPLNERVERAMQSEVLQAIRAGLEQGMEPGEVVEVVPAERFFFGGDSAKNPKLDKMFVEVKSSPREGEEPSTREYARGFGEVLLTLAHREDGSRFVTGAIPASWGTEFTKVGRFDAASRSAPDVQAEDDHDDLPEPVDTRHLMAPAM